MHKPETEYFIEFEDKDQYLQFHGLVYLTTSPELGHKLLMSTLKAVEAVLANFLGVLCRLNETTSVLCRERLLGIADVMEISAKQIRRKLALWETSPPVVRDTPPDEGSLRNMLDDIEGL